MKGAQPRKNFIHVGVIKMPTAFTGPRFQYTIRVITSLSDDTRPHRDHSPYKYRDEYDERVNAPTEVKWSNGQGWPVKL